MPERAFFSLRHAVPGYTLILLIIGINYVPLVKILECLSRLGIQSDIFLAALSLLSGAPFGFLISQFWWWLFHQMGADYQLDPRSANALINKYGLTRPKCLQEKKKTVVLHDYVLHYEGQCKKTVFRYIERRWDLYLILKSEMITLLIGLMFGIGFRVVIFAHIPWRGIEFPVLLVISVLVVVLLFLLCSGARWVQFQHDIMSVAIINASTLKNCDLAKVFPPYIFDFSISEKQGMDLERAGISSVSDLAKADPKELSKDIVISEEIILKWVKNAKEFMNK